MIDSRLDELVQLRVDGRLSSEEENELDLLLRDDEARKYLDEITSMAASLDELGELSPPVELPARISAVIANESMDVHAPASAKDSSGSAWNRRHAVRVGLFLAATIAVAFMLTPVVVNQLDTDQLGGTMTSVDAETNGPPVTWSIPVTASGIEGSISVERTSHRVLVDLRLHTSDSAQAVIRFEPGVIGLETVDGVPDSSAVRMDRPGEIAVALSSEGVQLAFARHSREKSSLRVEILRQEADAPGMKTEFEETINF